jgi:hypothetical protein
MRRSDRFRAKNSKQTKRKSYDRTAVTPGDENAREYGANINAAGRLVGMGNGYPKTKLAGLT